MTSLLCNKTHCEEEKLRQAISAPFAPLTTDFLITPTYISAFIWGNEYNLLTEGFCLK